MERFSEEKLGERGFGVFAKEASVGGWDSCASAEGTGEGRECRKEVRRWELWI